MSAVLDQASLHRATSYAVEVDVAAAGTALERARMAQGWADAQGQLADAATWLHAAVWHYTQVGETPYAARAADAEAALRSWSVADPGDLGDLATFQTATLGTFPGVLRALDADAQREGAADGTVVFWAVTGTFALVIAADLFDLHWGRDVAGGRVRRRALGGSVGWERDSDGTYTSDAAPGYALRRLHPGRNRESTVRHGPVGWYVRRPDGEWRHLGPDLERAQRRVLELAVDAATRPAVVTCDVCGRPERTADPHTHVGLRPW